MKSIISRSSVSVALALAVTMCVAAINAQAAPDIAPTTQPSARTPEVVSQEISATLDSFREALGSPEALSDPAKRSELAPKVIPLVKTVVRDLGELVTLRPELKSKMSTAKIEFLSVLSTLGDADGTKQLAALAASKDSEEMINGRSGQLETRWMLANQDAALQTPIADELEKLDAAHADSNALTRLTMNLSQMAANQELSMRLRGITLKMTSPMAQAMNQEMKQEEAAQAQLKSNEGKPVVIAGKDPDGKAFTTADWKGKVILVDFWATWCGPCKAELPRVKQIYSQYHPKGLELVGVSNDYSPDALKTFVAQSQMPWQELYDAAAGSQEKWNPITLGFGINGIPTMFLIDKKGVLRTVEARENMEEMIPKLLAE